ncbi:uncharacterized protein M8220_012335 [Acridotheres tristis]
MDGELSQWDNHSDLEDSLWDDTAEDSQWGDADDEDSQQDGESDEEIFKWEDEILREMYQKGEELKVQNSMEAEPAAAAPSGAAEEAAAGSGQAVEQTTDDSDEEMKFLQFLDDLEPSLEEPVGQIVTGGDGSTTSGHSNLEDNNDQEPVQENWGDNIKPSMETKLFCPEDDKLDDVSVLELPPEDKDQKRKAFAADGLPVPVPREAWVEEPALEPSVPRKHRSRFRRALRALRGLFRCPCLRPRAQP